MTAKKKTVLYVKMELVSTTNAIVMMVSEVVVARCQVQRIEYFHTFNQSAKNVPNQQQKI